MAVHLKESLGDRIAQEVSSPDWAAAERIKAAITQEFKRIDARTHITDTGYFRHSFIPDLVLHWGDDHTRNDRPVFLRDNQDLSWLYADTRLLAAEQPIMFGLGRTPRPAAHANDENPETSAPYASGALITDPYGAEHLVPSRSTPNIDSLVSRSILRGGRGVFDGTSTVQVVETMRAGFAGVFTGDIGAATAAVAMVATYFGEGSGNRIVDLLTAIWEANGFERGAFPVGRVAHSGSMPDDALEFLLSLDGEVSDVNFWQRVGSQVKMEQLCRLQVGAQPKNLRHFLAANAKGLDARACRVWAAEAQLDPYQWRIESKAVTWHGGTFVAFFTDGTESMKLKPEAAVPPNLTALSERQPVGVSIERVVVEGGNTKVEWVGMDHRDVLGDDGLDLAIDGLSAAHQVVQATAYLPSGRIIECDLANASANCRTSGTLTLWEAVAYGLPLIWDLHPADVDAVAQFLAVAPERPTRGRDKNSQPSLLESDPAGADAANALNPAMPAAQQTEGTTLARVRDLLPADPALLAAIAIAELRLTRGGDGADAKPAPEFVAALRARLDRE